MKQKLAMVSLILLSIVTLAIGYFIYSQNQKNTVLLEQSQQSSQKQITDLNDRLVAVARQQNTPETKTDRFLDSSQQINQLQLNLQQQELREFEQQWTLTALQLIQQRLNESDYREVQSLLLQLQQNISASYKTQPTPLQTTLLQTLKIDQLNIQQQQIRQQQLQQTTDRVLAQLQQQLNIMAIKPPTSMGTQTSAPSSITAWWQHLLIVERSNPANTQHQLDRSFVCKQASLNLAMARLALMQNNRTDFVRYLDEAIGQLEPLAQLDTRQIVATLTKVSNQPFAERIQLTSLTLLTGAKMPTQKRLP